MATALSHPDFRRLWAADALSSFGARVGMLAVPLLALLDLDASAFDVALLTSLQTMGSLFLGLAAGAWLDRMRCRPVLVAADLVRFGVLAGVPIAALTDTLTLVQLYVVVFVSSLAGVFFDTGSTTYLPRIVPRELLVDANSKIATNHSVAAVLAGGVGGFVVQLLTAPVAVAIDAVSYLWSALWLRRIRAAEAVPERRPGTRLRTDIAEGLRFVLRHPVLRALAGYSAGTIFFQTMGTAVGIVFLTRNVGLGPGAVGLVSMTGLLGALVAGFATARLASRIGTARTMWLSAVTYSVGFLIQPLTVPGWGLAYWIVGNLLVSFAIIAMHIMRVSTRQLLCPPHLYGRVGATMDFALWGVMPLGGLAGGVAATLVGVRSTLWIVGVGVTVSALWILLSPLRTMRDVDTTTASEAGRPADEPVPRPASAPDDVPDLVSARGDVDRP